MDNQERAVNKLTGAMIDACSESFTQDVLATEGLSASEVSESDSAIDAEAFERLLRESEDLREYLLTSIVALYGDPDRIRAGIDAVRTEQEQGLNARTDDVYKAVVGKIPVDIKFLASVFSAFFFLGFNARGVIEDEEELKGLV